MIPWVEVIVLVAVLLSMLLLAAPAEAAVVTNLNDSGPGSLRQVLADVPPGETISLPDGTIALTSGELTIDKNVTIAGARTTIRANGSFRVFELTGAPTVTLGGITIEGGAAPMGGGILARGDLTLFHVTVTGNRAVGSGAAGGGIALDSGGYLRLKESQILDNTAGSGVAGGGEGGGIWLEAGSGELGRIELSGSVISGNSAGGGAAGAAGAGGGIRMTASGGLGISLDAQASEISLNRAGGGAPGATGTGGGIDVVTTDGNVHARTLLTNTTVSGNRAGGEGADGSGGGARFMPAPGGSGIKEMTFTFTTLAANVAATTGGGVETSAGGIGAAESIVAENLAPSDPNCHGALTSFGWNVSNGGCNLAADGDVDTQDARLEPLGAYGGPVRTMPPKAGSVAIDRRTGWDTCFSLYDARGALRGIGPGCDAGAVELGRPLASFVQARDVTETTTTLAGRLDPNASLTTYHWEYGRTTSYGLATAPRQVLPNAPVDVTQFLAGLRPNTTYHYRLVASNAVATSDGFDLSFHTVPRRPVVGRFRVAPDRFAVGRRATTFRFRLSDPTSVRILIEAVLPGRRRAGRCLEPSRRLSGYPRCTRYRRAGVIARAGLSAGSHSLAFGGRIGRHALKPGRYRATVVASTKGQPRKSIPLRDLFTVVPAG